MAKYNTKRVIGFTKTLTVVIKDSNPVVLTIKGKVLPEAQPIEMTPKKD